MARDAELVEYDDGVVAFVVSGRREPTEQRHDLRKLRDSGVDTREVVRRIVDDHREDQLVENDRHDFESRHDRPHPLTTVDATVTQAASLTAHDARDALAPTTEITAPSHRAEESADRRIRSEERGSLVDRVDTGRD
jgi:hypothetical protein